MKIFLSWGDEIYGPCSSEDVIAGIRASWFEEGALYWHEGLDEWQPVCDFPACRPGTAMKDWQRVMPSELPAAPTLPVATGHAKSQRTQPRRPRASKPSARRLGRGGRAIFFAIALLAVLLTIGILLLLMRF